MNNFYEKHIQGGRNITVIAVLLFIAVRLVFVFSDENLLPTDVDGGLLWNVLKNLIPSVNFSIGLASAFAFTIAVLLGWANNKHAIIRKRTLLPSAFVILLFSIDPDFILMSPHYVAALFFVLSLDALFASYQDERGQRRGVDVGVYLAIASLFVTEYLVLIPLFLIGFVMMRSFTLKMFLSIILSLVLIFSIAAGYFIYTNQTDLLLSQFDFEMLDSIYILSLPSLTNYVVAVLGLVFWIVLAVDNRMNNFKDKTRVRECVTFFHLLLIFSFLVYCLSPIASVSEAMHMPLLITMAFILARFWEIATKPWKIYSFFFMMMVYFYFVFHNIGTSF